jgi:hypothetical protein
VRDNPVMAAVQSLTATWLNCGVHFVWVTQQYHSHRHSRVTMPYMLPKIGKAFSLLTTAAILKSMCRTYVYEYIRKNWQYFSSTWNI